MSYLGTGRRVVAGIAAGAALGGAVPAVHELATDTREYLRDREACLQGPSQQGYSSKYGSFILKFSKQCQPFEVEIAADVRQNQVMGTFEMTNLYDAKDTLEIVVTEDGYPQDEVKKAVQGQIDGRREERDAALFWGSILFGLTSTTTFILLDNRALRRQKDTDSH